MQNLCGSVLTYAYMKFTANLAVLLYKQPQLFMLPLICIWYTYCHSHGLKKIQQSEWVQKVTITSVLRWKPRHQFPPLPPSPLTFPLIWASIQRLILPHSSVAIIRRLTSLATLFVYIPQARLQRPSSLHTETGSSNKRRAVLCNHCTLPKSITNFL